MTDNNGIVLIHGREYMTVAKRVELWLEENKANNDGYSIETEVLSHTPVVVKATVSWRKRTFSGISAVLPDTATTIEKLNPYEVAETSAVGRALGFAGFGLIEGIPSADEMHKATAPRPVGRPPKVQPTVNANGEALPWEENGHTDEAKAYVESKLGKPLTADEEVMKASVDASLEEALTCQTCGKPATEKHGITKLGKPYHAIFCDTGEKSHAQWLND